MKLLIPNVAHVCCFIKDAGNVMTISQFEKAYGFEPDGINMYYGINQTNLDYFNARDGKSALSGDKRRFIETVISSLLRSASPSKYITIGMEPTGEGAYDFVHKHLDMVTQLAKDLDVYQKKQELADAGKELKIAIRYASEMNDRVSPKTPYAENPAAYKKSFREVRDIFRNHAPKVEFSFSPAIRADIYRKQTAGTLKTIDHYWPGDDSVDIVGGTWYIGNEGDSYHSGKLFKEYLKWTEQFNKPYGLEEVGGRDILEPTEMDGGYRLLEMAKQIAASGKKFNYITLFMEAKWKLVSLSPIKEKYLKEQ